MERQWPFLERRIIMELGEGLKKILLVGIGTAKQ